MLRAGLGKGKADGVAARDACAAANVFDASSADAALGNHVDDDDSFPGLGDVIPLDAQARREEDEAERDSDSAQDLQ